MRMRLNFSINLALLLFHLNVICEEVGPGTFPWLVSLYNIDGHFCAGSIINKRLVLTAASCVDWKSHQSFRIRVGSLNYLAGGKLISLEKVICHPGYNQDDHIDDIAIVITKKDLEFNRYVKDVPVARNQLARPTTAFVMGWQKYDGSGLTYQLQFEQVKTISARRCAHSIGNIFIQDRMICTQMDKLSKYLCKGDIGGPLIINGTLYGILSWGNGCRPPDSPAIFTAVHFYIDWIKEISHKNNLTNF